MKLIQNVRSCRLSGIDRKLIGCVVDSSLLHAVHVIVDVISPKKSCLIIVFLSFYFLILILHE